LNKLGITTKRRRAFSGIQDTKAARGSSAQIEQPTTIKKARCNGIHSGD
jgi:hypothetical protein